jgi:hypothetical protein
MLKERCGATTSGVVVMRSTNTPLDTCARGGVGGGGAGEGGEGG